jgi:hypothetical protein
MMATTGGKHAMQFGTFGPFEIPVDKWGNISTSLSDFWEAVEIEWAGLSDGRGCYVFGLSKSGGSRIEPWYVGKTNKQGFESECFKAHQLNHYGRALNRYHRAKPHIYLIPQFTNNGARLYRGKAGAGIDFLETYLIGIALRANFDLLNKRDTKLYREVILSGLLNSTQGSPGAAAIKLRKSLSF